MNEFYMKSRSTCFAKDHVLFSFGFDVINRYHLIIIHYCPTQLITNNVQTTSTFFDLIWGFDGKVRRCTRLTFSLYVSVWRKYNVTHLPITGISVAITQSLYLCVSILWCRVSCLLPLATIVHLNIVHTMSSHLD